MSGRLRRSLVWIVTPQSVVEDRTFFFVLGAVVGVIVTGIAVWLGV